MVKCPVCQKEFKTKIGMHVHLSRTQDANHMKHPKSIFYSGVEERSPEEFDAYDLGQRGNEE